MDQAVKAAEKKAFSGMKKVKGTETVRKMRKTLWFEKFLWFVSSDGLIVVGGRDAQQNEVFFCFIIFVLLFLFFVFCFLFFVFCFLFFVFCFLFFVFVTDFQFDFLPDACEKISPKGRCLCPC